MLLVALSWVCDRLLFSFILPLSLYVCGKSEWIEERMEEYKSVTYK